MSQTPACPDVPALPCPFCGGPVVTFTQNGSGYQISCEAACAETPWYETVDDAKAWWNTRALPSTALAARPEEGWQIKLLEWKRPPGAITLKRGATEIGTYRSWTHAEAAGEWFWEFANIDGSGPVVDGSGASEIEVQAAAQADYENRIRSAFVAPSTPPTAGDGHD